MTASRHSFNPEQFFNAGAFNPADLMESQRRNTEAFTTASKEATEAAKALTQCQTKFCREQMEDMATFWKNWMSSGSNIQDKMEIQNQATRDGLAKAMAHSKEVAAILQKSQEKVMSSFGERAKETVKEATKQATKVKENINEVAKQATKTNK